ncbi:MAG: M23 family metallopeptidase [Candidatus Taylorbacteria bacterium]|nr:M23 family metallopeptidase [Candidatus Taylorbacteria bacterium]
MKKFALKILIIIFIFSLTKCVNASSTTTPLFVLKPSTVIQGEPVIITFENVKISEIKNITYDKKSLNIFLYNNKPTAFLAVDLYQKSNIYEVSVILTSGKIIKNNLTVNERTKKVEPMAVPDKLGGNSSSNQRAVVSELAKENTELSKTFTGKKAFWTDKFVWPVADHFVTDEYGYTRQTGIYNISHKGLDLRAKAGTKVVAMNRGVVRIAKNYQTYGKSIVVDHGLGLSTIYMHLSKINVNVGELVKPGQVIGLSGQTGYAEFPHLHLSIRINQISIDPEKFMDFFD